MGRVILLGRGGPIDGQQRQLLYLSRGLAGTSMQPTVILGEGGNLETALADFGVDTRIASQSPWRSLLNIVGRRRDAEALLRHGRAINPQLVHAQDVWRAEYARFVAKRLGVPYVVHVRGPLSPRDISKHRLELADATVAIAQRYVDDLVESGIDPLRISLIDDAVDLKLFNRSTADKLHLRTMIGATDQFVVGLVGRISREKKVEMLIRAAAALPVAMRGRVLFVIAGGWDDPDYQSSIEAELATLGLQPVVRSIGRTEARNMPNLLAGIDALITFSGGSVMFEAMAMGTPVISVREDGRHSQHTIHDKTAWCLTSSSPVDAAGVVAHLASDEPLRAGIGEAGRQHVRSRLSVDAMVEKTLDLYTQLTSGRS